MMFRSSFSQSALRSHLSQPAVPYILSIAGFVVLQLFWSWQPKPAVVSGASAPHSGSGEPFQTVRSFSMPNSIDFCGETVPLDNFDNRERLERELLENAYKHGTTLQTYKLSSRLFPLIEPILAQNGVPMDMKYLAIAESNLRETAASPAGAKGVWQFMPATAAQYGLLVNSEVDERLNTERATEAACRYLKTAYERFGNWTMAAASYNMGVAGLSNNATQQRGTAFYDLFLSDETNRYIFRIIAFKELLTKPREYGFFITDPYAPIDCSLVEVEGSVPNWGEWAQRYGMSYRMLRVLNPWIKAENLTNANHHRYIVKVWKR